MAKVEGSNPFIRFTESPGSLGVLWFSMTDESATSRRG
jgi:hypothetical protein